MTAPRQTCRRCGRTLQARDAEGLSGEKICARCRRSIEEESGPEVDPRTARQEEAADFLSSLGGTRFEGQRLSRWGMFAVGVAAALVGICAGFLGVLAI